jgi:hypothetical protein
MALRDVAPGVFLGKAKWIAIGLPSYGYESNVIHVLAIQGHSIDENGNTTLNVQRCKYTQIDAVAKALKKVWDLRKAVVLEYFEGKGLDLPEGLDFEDSQTINEERLEIVADIICGKSLITTGRFSQIATRTVLESHQQTWEIPEHPVDDTTDAYDRFFSNVFTDYAPT